jgi:hypothetical protein
MVAMLNLWSVGHVITIILLWQWGFAISAG